MSEQSPYEQLGVTENSSFEEIQAAKKKICEEKSSDEKAVEQIEAAYDAVIMDRLRLRQEGKIRVPERIRFPDREKVESPLKSVQLPSSSPSWIQTLLDNPSQREILVPSALFTVLSAIVIIFPTAVMTSLPLLMSVGFIATVYFINSKEKRFARSLIITLLMLVAGVSLGGILANSLANISPSALSENEVVGLGYAMTDSTTNPGLGQAIGMVRDRAAAVGAFISFWLASCFLK